MPLPDKIRPITRPSVNREICARLRTWVMDGVLKPGDVIRDHELALRLGVSRTPVREALLCLEAEGLVETSRNRWTRVSSVSIRTAEEIYPVISTLELLAVRLTPSLDERLTSELRAANAKLAEAIEKGYLTAAVDADMEFHRAIVEQCGNDELISTIEVLKRKHRRVELTYFGYPSMASGSVAEHNQIIAAIENKDLQGAAAALSANWRSGLLRFREFRKSSDSNSEES